MRKKKGERIGLLAELNRNNFKQEIIIQEKARHRWLKQGDLNTKYFHSKIKRGRLRNEFSGLITNSRWCEDLIVVKERLKSFSKIDLVGRVATG